MKNQTVTYKQFAVFILLFGFWSTSMVILEIHCVFVAFAI